MGGENAIVDIARPGAQIRQSRLRYETV